MSTFVRCSSEINDPTWVAGSSGSPTTSASAAATKRSTNSSCTEDSTKTRVPLEHTSPWVAKFASTAASTARSISASANTSKGDLPPSSSVTGTGPAAAARMTARPVGTDPVTVILSTPTCELRASPTNPSPCTTEKTPGGNPASSSTSANATALSGVCSEGLKTIALPAASAGAAFQQAICSG